jgi:glycosyltransferase involved in cell wall biosynthesis
VPEPREALLCAVPFQSTRGYAWDFLGGLYAALANHLAGHDIRTFVAYPSIPAPPPALAGSMARAVELDTSMSTPESVRALLEFVRRENVRVIHLISQPPWSLAYFRLRRAGARRIIVYDHTSGEFTRPRGLKRAAKWLLARMPGIGADALLAVSNFVARRLVDVGVVPKSKVVTVHNGIPIASAEGGSERLRARLSLPAGRPIVMCNCRATPEKGVQHLLRAFDRALQDWEATSPRPLLIYVGGGPQLAELQSLRNSLASKDDIILTGYRSDARELLEGADLCVVPSVWQDAFPLAVLEAMARGKPVIATRVGGIPEMVEDEVTGLLVPPGDEAALAAALTRLLAQPARAAQLGQAAQARVAREFTPEKQFRVLARVVEEGFGHVCDEMRE